MENGQKRAINKRILYRILFLAAPIIYLVIELNLDNIKEGWRSLVLTVKRDGVAYHVDLSKKEASVVRLEEAYAWIPSNFRPSNGWGMVKEKKYALTDVHIPTYIRYFGVKMPVTCIGRHAFWACTDLQTIELPDSLKYIEDDAFCMCKQLHDVAFPPSLQFIGETAFAQCDSIRHVVIPGNCRISRKAYIGCKSLESVVIGREQEEVVEDVRSDAVLNLTTNAPDDFFAKRFIGTGAFSECPSLCSVRIYQIAALLQTTAHIVFELFDNTVFGSCPNLKDIYVSDSCYYIRVVDNVIFNKNMQNLQVCPAGLEGEYVVPESVKEIKQYAFKGCRKLTDIYLSEATKAIGHDAFYGCDSTIVHYPAKMIVYYDSTTFIGCKEAKPY